MMETALWIVFFCSLAPVLVLAIFPVWTIINARFRSNPIDKNNDFTPPVSIIIACYNEEEYIEQKVKSILAPENWIAGSELIVVSGGSTDKTNERLRTFESRAELRLIFLPERTSKIDAVNLAVSLSKHDFYVFSDCRQEMKSGSIQQLIHNLHDPEVGTVTATLSDVNLDRKPSFFRALFNRMACAQSAYSSCLNVYGALYAQRKSVYREIPNNLLFDDLFVLVSTLKQRKRVIQEQQAIIFDVPFDSYYQKERIRRLVRGLLIFLFNNSALIFSLRKRTLIRFFIYKYLKLLLPFFLLICTACALLLLLRSDSASSLALVLCVLLLLFVLILRRQTLHFIRINVQIFMATSAFLFGSQRSNEWEKLTTDSK